MQDARCCTLQADTPNPRAEHEMSIFLSPLMPSPLVCLHLIHVGYSGTTIILPSHLLGLAGDIWDVQDGSSSAQSSVRDTGKHTITLTPECIQSFK